MKSRNYFWGIAFILAAVFVLLGNFGFFRDINLIKILITLVLIYFIVQNIPSRNFYGIFIPAALICCLYDDLLHIHLITPFPIIAASILLSIGLTFLFPSQPHFKPDAEFDFGSGQTTYQSYTEDSEINCNVSFAGASKYINTSDFRRAYLKCTFGALKAYFDHAQITGTSAEIYVNNTFGETSLFLPKDWNVHVTATTTFGDIEEIHKPPVPMAGSPSVTICGNISFGDCKIYYI